MPLNAITKIVAYILSGLAYGTLFHLYVRPNLDQFIELPGSLLAFAHLGPMIILVSYGAGEFAKRVRNKEAMRKELSMSWEKRLWNGDIPLHLAFWFYHIFGAACITLSVQFIISRVINESAGQLIFWGVVFALFGAGYHILSTVGTLRSARRYKGSKKWVFLAKIGIVLSSVAILVGLVLAIFGVNIFADL